MSTTITALAGVQRTDGSAKIDITATVTDTVGAVLGLKYEFKHASESVWMPAVTNGPLQITATPGGAALAFAWDLDASSIDSTATADFNFRVTASKEAVAASGSVTAVAADSSTGLADGDAVQIAGVTYEFTVDAGLTSPGAVPVLITGTATDSAVKTALLAAITGNADAGVTATSGAGQLIDLVETTPGVDGNVAIVELLANAGVTLTPVGLEGGLDATESAATASVSFTGVETGGVAPLPETVTIPVSSVSRNTLYVSRFEKLGKVLGSTPQAFMGGAALYSRLDALRDGRYDKFEYDVNYTEVVDDLTIQQLDANSSLATLVQPGSPSRPSARTQLSTASRAVLISVAEYNRVTAGKTLQPIMEVKQWLAHKAWRSLTRVFAKPETIYAIYENTFSNGPRGTLVATKTVIAYFMTAANYESLRA